MEQIKDKTGNIMSINSFAVRETKPLGYMFFFVEHGVEKIKHNK